MGQTKGVYPVMEIAISLEDCAPHTNGTKERKLVGDIIGIRHPNTEIGAKETTGYLWLRIEGLEVNEMARLTDPITNRPDNADEATAVFEKRRYCIPLNRLKAIVPSLNLARALDPADAYQPFLTIDQDGPFRYLTTTRPLMVHGLVFDKLTGRYL